MQDFCTFCGSDGETDVLLLELFANGGDVA